MTRHAVDHRRDEESAPAALRKELGPFLLNNTPFTRLVCVSGVARSTLINKVNGLERRYRNQVTIDDDSLDFRSPIVFAPSMARFSSIRLLSVTGNSLAWNLNDTRDSD